MSGQDSGTKNAWIERVLGIRVGGDAAGSQLDVAGLTKRLAALLEQIAAIGSPPDLMDDLRSAGSALKGGQLGMAAGLLDEIAARITGRARAADAAADIAKAAPSKGVGVVAFAKLRLRWTATQQAREQALDNMHAVCAAMLADPEAEDDPQYEEMQAAAAAIGDRMPDFGSAIDDAMDAMSTTDQDKREAARKAAIAAIRSYRTELDAEPALKLLQDMPVGKFAIYDGIVGALGELEAALAG